MTPVPADPKALTVQWLEDSLLVHGVTVAGPPPGVDVHRLLAATVLCAVGIGGASWVGVPWLAAILAVPWLAGAVAMGVLAWRTSRRVAPPPRRILVELRAEQVRWTLLAGDRWSMRHEHELAVGDIVGAAAAGTPSGVAVEVRLADGTSRAIPLYGMPHGDAAWLAAQIDDVLVAAADDLVARE